MPSPQWLLPKKWNHEKVFAYLGQHAKRITCKEKDDKSQKLKLHFSLSEESFLL